MSDAVNDPVNIGKSFPLEKLASDITRNNYNYQSILTGLIKWNNTTDDAVNIRLTKDTAPWFEDYTIPSKKSVLTLNDSASNVSGTVFADNYDITSILNCTVATGNKDIKMSSFSVELGSDIVLSDAKYFDINDVVMFSGDSGAVLPTAISSTALYYVVSKVDNTLKVSSTYQGVPLIFSDGSGTIDIYKFNSTPDVLDDGTGDSIVAKITVSNVGNTSWGLYYTPVIYEYSVNNEYKAGLYVKSANILYRTIFDSFSTELYPVDLPNIFRKLIYNWASGENYYAGDILIDTTDTVAYRVVRDSMQSIISPENDTDNCEFYASAWVQYSTYTKGSYVMYTNDSSVTKFYLATSDIVNSSSNPVTDTSNWEDTLIFYVPSGLSITQSVVIRWTPTTDVSTFVLKNIGSEASTSDTSITIKISVKTKEPDSIYQKSVGIFPNTNYTMWPDDDSAVWLSENTYGPTDTNISISKRQSYSASMIFDHTNMKTAKTVNYINYSGPDLDQGLCIYLPVEVDVGDDGIAYPEDGFTYDFFFRIWPNPVLNGDLTRDHTVNKAQIYVYSVLNHDNVSDDICENPIAKFSMARTTNFYMFGENVSIPDRPVCYRATFTYSSSEKRWNCLDYYQLPDHIFVGPVGFIDPQSPANLDINNEIIGNINPNASVIGYETAAFPLFQDPFSNTDLTPYRFASDEDFNSFKNRII